MSQANNKRIAKNTIILCVRMLIGMGISLYTSRVVLNTLGVEDFGLYNVTGGIVAMFGFLSISMSNATSRFLTFELGQKNDSRLKKTFSAAMSIHLMIAAIILVLGETAGLWWLENKLVVSSERMDAVRWVYQFSIAAAVFSIVQVPYSAVIIAHEKMNVYAYIVILQSLLKLGIVYLLIIDNFDKLVLYAALTLGVSIVITATYRMYCTKKIPESRFTITWEKEIVIPMLSFSSWTFYLNTSHTFKTNGVNMILNLFFGALINTAYSIAIQVQNAALQFAGSFLTAVRPQITKLYAAGDMSGMQNLIVNTSKYSFLLLFLIAFPLTVENNFILHLWLGNVPDFAVLFSRLSIVYVVIFWSNSAIITAIEATGKVKRYCLIDGTLFLLVLPVSYLLLKAGYSPAVPLIINIFLLLVGVLINVWNLKRVVPEFSIKKFILKFYLISVVIVIITSVLPLWFYFSLNEGIVRFLLVSGSFAVVLCASTYWIAFNQNMRMRVRLLISNKLKILKL